jgi:putative endonuclease
MNSLLQKLMSRMLGDAGERAAAKHLRGLGMKIITRGYRTSRGEIDLVAREGRSLVFVEVKTRRRGEPVEAVTLVKQRRLCRAALQFVSRFGLHGVPARFDVVSVVWPEGLRRPTIEHIRHAFDFTEFDEGRG